MTKFKLNDIIGTLSRFIRVSEEKPVTYRLFMSDGLRAKFKSLCALKQISMNDVLIDLIKKWIDENDPNSRNT